MFRVRVAVTGPGGSIERAMDFMTFRHGRMLGSLSYMTVKGLRPEESSGSRRSRPRSSGGANASLPEA